MEHLLTDMTTVTSLEQVVVIFLLLLFKHTVADYLLQKPWKDKGTYGAPGGLVHAGHHIVGTFLVLIFFCDWFTTLYLAFLDGYIHYHIDYAKNNIKRIFKLNNTHTLYWGLHGLDQYLHILTYILIIYILGV